MLNHPDFGPLYAGPVTLPDGRIAYVCPLTFGRARLQIGTAHWIEDGY